MATSSDEGQVVPLLAVVVLLACLALVGVARLGGAATVRAQARTAADAAALAGAAAGRDAAVETATANGARLVAYDEDGADVVVQVELQGARATARARGELADGDTWGRPADGGGRGGRTQEGLAPAMRVALGQAEGLLGQPVPITSGYRSTTRQAELWARRDANPYPVARPGTSKHERGLAVDIPLSFVPRLLAVAGQVGLCQTLPDTDPVHFELCTPGPGRS